MIKNIVTMDNIGGGIAPALFQKGLNRVLDNIADNATSAVKERKIKMTFTIKPDEEKTGVSVKVNMETMLAQVGSKTAAAFLSVDEDGDFHMTTSDPKQMELADQLTGLNGLKEKAGNE
ncbi:hypothetical protein KAR91_02350 [Candidatus Pacearchaeota archaeon]|nr:hypothetical protein [Candidatus Pacearchaeota archaeon]